MNKYWKIGLLLTIFIVCLSFDLISKSLAKQYLQYRPVIQIISNFAELRYTENDAIAFSMLKSIALPTRNIIIYTTSLVAFVILGIITFQSRRESLLWLSSLMLILAGAVGNLCDRIINGSVVDFIHLHYKNKFSWPIFNIADILITIGAILLAILMLHRQKYNE